MRGGGGREASSFYKFPRNVIMSQEHHKNIRWERRVDLVGLFTTVIYASESEERELCPSAVAPSSPKSHEENVRTNSSSSTHTQ